MNYVQYLLDSDVKVNLTEIVTQNKDVITSKLLLKLNNLDSVAQQLSDRYYKSETTNNESMKAIFKEYAAEKENGRLFYADKEGKGIFSDGSEMDISGRNYFCLAIDGTPNISERIVSRIDGSDIFVISVPLSYNGEIIGVLQQQYTPKEIYDICSVSLFSEQGNMYIINSQGYILVSSQQDIYSRESDNYYRLIYMENPDATSKLQADISGNKDGFMEIVLDGQRYFSAYTPVNQVYDWYLISSIETNAVAENAAIVIRLFYIVLVAVVLFLAVGMVYVFYLRSRQESKLKRIAFVDSVTGGNTYTKFIYELQLILQKKENKDYCIFAFDIDNFKYINSCYGFKAGDRILKGINDLYVSSLNQHELIARIYNDHFVMLLEDNSRQRMKDIFIPEFEMDGITIFLSAGIYPVSDPTESIHLMVDKANMAAQKSKGMQFKQVEIYSEQFDKDMKYNEEIKRSIEQALQNKEIVPYYQPKVNVFDRKLVGAEALARWQKPDGKLVPPDAFIPICEKNGLILSIDMCIFECTLQFIKDNLEKGISCVPISVNFSRLHLMNKDFVSILLEKFNEYGVPHHLSFVWVCFYDLFNRMWEFEKRC